MTVPCSSRTRPRPPGDEPHHRLCPACFILECVRPSSPLPIRTCSHARRRGRRRGARPLRDVAALVAIGTVLTWTAAATPIPPASVRGIMVQQAIDVLGGTLAPCQALLEAGLLEPPPGSGDADTEPAQAPATTEFDGAPGELTCARIPSGMYGHVRVAVRGRLYEYLRRGTLLTLSDWDRTRDDRRVDYVVDRGVLRIERHKLDGVSYVTFWFLLPDTDE